MKPEQAMRIYLAECSVHAAVLDEGLVDAKQLMLLSNGTHLDKKLLRVLDQLAYRFTKLQDSIGEKVLPLLLELTQESISSGATFAEKLNKLEHIGAIPSTNEWKKFRVARNAVAHEFPDDPELRISTINRFLVGAIKLSELYQHVIQYVAEHFPELAIAHRTSVSRAVEAHENGKVLRRIKHLSDGAKTHQGFRRYFANTSWMFAEQIMRMVAGLLVGIWVARYLGPAQFGVFSYAIAFTALFSSIAKLGLDSIIVRDLVRDPSQRDLYIGTAFWLKVSGAIVMLAVIALTTQLTSNDPTTELYILIIASGFIFQSFEVVDFYFQSKALSKFVSICKLTQLLLSSVLKIYFVLTGAGLFWFVVVSVVDQTTLAASLYIAYRYQKLGSFFRHFDLITAKKLLKNSWPLMLSGLVIIIYQRIDQIMIKEMLGEKEVGLYSAAVRLSEVWYFIPMIITNSLFPAIINAKQISEEFYYGRLQNLYTLMVWLAIGIALPMTFLSDWLVTLLYGEAYRAGGQVLMIYIWAAVFVFFGCAWSQWMLIENRTKTPTFFHINTMLWNVILNLFLIPKFGIIGAALSALISASIGHTLLPLFIRSQRIALKMFLYSFIPIYLIKRQPK
ncbi:MAG: flippase [Methylococcales bacterium]|nr:flippase [Methylococcales bacterium]